MDKTKKRNNLKQKNAHKQSTNKILDRITFNPQKHKHKVKKKLRQELQDKTILPTLTRAPPTTLKFGSLNINGLDLEAAWAVEQLLTNKGLDVSVQTNFSEHCFTIIIY